MSLSEIVALVTMTFWLLFTPISAHAQQKDSTQAFIPEDYQVKKNKEDSLLYSNLKKRFSKNRVLNEIYHALFKDVYNQNSAGQEVVKIDENPFQEYEGRVVRKIYVKTLRVFGESVNDTARKAQGFEKFFSALHTNTRESIIRKSFLLFHTGDIISYYSTRAISSMPTDFVTTSV